MKSIETDLVCALSRTHIGGEEDALTRTLLSKNISWDAVNQTASRLQVRPLVWNHLLESYSQFLPDDVARDLRADRERFRLYSHTRTIALLNVLRHLAAADISCIPLKGPVLGRELYGHESLRGFGDFDLLVQPRDFFRAREILLACGFSATHAREQDAARLEERYPADFVKGGLKIELHPSLMPRVYALPLDHGDGVFQRARSICIGDLHVSVLSHEDLFIYLCVHGAKHRWPALRLVCDVAELSARMTDHDWSRLIDLANRTACTRVVSIGLILSRNLFGTVLPAHVGKWVARDRKAASMARGYERALVAPSTIARQPNVLERILAYEPVEYLRAWYPVRERLVDRLQYIGRFAVLPTARDHALVKLPRSLSFLHAVARPPRVLFNLCRVAVSART